MKTPPLADVVIPAGDVRLDGTVWLPPQPVGLAVFAHGTGSNRSSARNRFVAEVLYEAGIGSLLFDLLTPEEALEGGALFEVPVLARRLVDAVAWVGTQPALAPLPFGYAGSSTGAAAALAAAVIGHRKPAAIVSRSGRPDLAGPCLPLVTAPVLLIVGGEDRPVLALHEALLPLLDAVGQLAVVPGATHLFEEPGTLEEAARLTAAWLQRMLVGG